ncbi:hypothetical protein DSO57_1030730 [Entomophthora muscae]|uniref:Uncharacterized protein n=1 Tax=Entomophthora muscae TaxID=34485 RepID=A0ACC2RFK4_9FUNG|nr:hypothetical protein DSO57_1030730 [Entomophthora muscae]
MSRRSPRIAARASISPQKGGAAFQLKTQNVIPLADASSIKPALNEINLRKDKALAEKETLPSEKEASTEQLENNSQTPLNDESLEGSSICDRTIYPDTCDHDCSISTSNILGDLSSDFLTDYEIELEFNGRDSDVECWSPVLSCPYQNEDCKALADEIELDQLTDDVASLNYSDCEDPLVWSPGFSPSSSD